MNCVSHQKELQMNITDLRNLVAARRAERLGKQAQQAEPVKKEPKSEAPAPVEEPKTESVVGTPVEEAPAEEPAVEPAPVEEAPAEEPVAEEKPSKKASKKSAKKGKKD